MSERKKRWGIWDIVLVAIGLLPVLAAIMLYDQLPDLMASHFDLNGNVNGYQPKFTFLLIFGLLTPGMPLLMKIMRYIDPKRANYEKFDSAFEIVRFVLTLFMAILFAIILFYNLGYLFSVQTFILLIMGILFLIVGNYMGQFRFNYSIGIRTPWTLSNEEVWRRTHRMAAPWWMIAGLIAIISAFVPGMYTAWIFGIAIALSVVVPTIYSYLLFRRTGNNKN